MTESTAAASAAPVTVTTWVFRSAVTDEPGMSRCRALLIVPTQWPQVMSGTRTAMAALAEEVWWVGADIARLRCSAFETLRAFQMGRSRAPARGAAERGLDLPNV